MELRNFLIAIRKYWYVIVACSVAGLLVGGFRYVGAESTYQGTVTFFVSTSGEGNVAAAAQADQFAQRRVNSYAALLTSDRLTLRMSEELDGEISSRQIGRMIEATGAIDTVLLTASVTSSSESEVTEVTDLVASEFPGIVNEIEGQGVGTTTVSLEVVSGPTVREVPPSKVNTFGMPVLLGAAVGLVGAVVLRLRDSTIADAEEVESLGLGPVLASIPESRSSSATPLVLDDDTGSAKAEAFRQLRTNLRFLDAQKPLGLLLVTSGGEQEGKTLTAANLGLLLTAAGSRVLILEADMRRPALSTLFGLEQHAGLSDVLSARAEYKDVKQTWGRDELSILSSGPPPPNPSELLSSPKMRSLLKQLKADYDAVVIDSPPVLPVSDAIVLSREVDGVLVVARTGRTKRADVQRASKSLEMVGARVLGTVLTFVPSKKSQTYETYTMDE